MVTTHSRGADCRGFTAIEMIIVVVVVGVMMAVALPFFRGSTDQANVRGAGDALQSLHAVARNAAIQRGRTSVLVLTGAANTAHVVVRRSGSTAVDTLGRVENLYSRFGVALASSADSVVFTPRGIGASLTNTTIRVSKGSYADTLTISAGGRLTR